MVLTLLVSAVERVCSPKRSFPKLVMSGPGVRNTPVSSNRVVGVMPTFASRAAVVVTTLKVEPGGYRPIVAHDLNPLLSVLSGAIYLLDGHAHFDALDGVVEEELLSHLYGTPIQVVRTPQGELYMRSTP